MLTIQVEQEVDGRWIVEVMELPGAISYGECRQFAIDSACALSLRILADRLEQGEGISEISDLFRISP